MPRHLAHDVHLDPGIGDPGESCVPEDMAAHVLVAELGDDVVPVGGVAQDRGGDTAAPRPGEQADDRGRRPDGETCIGLQPGNPARGRPTPAVEAGAGDAEKGAQPLHAVAALVVGDALEAVHSASPQRNTSPPCGDLASSSSL